MSQHILFIISLVIWFVIRIICELIGQEMLSRLEQDGQDVEFNHSRFSLKLIQYVSLMKRYKTLLLSKEESTRPVTLFWIFSALTLLTGIAVLWLSIDVI